MAAMLDIGGPPRKQKSSRTPLGPSPKRGGEEGWMRPGGESGLCSPFPCREGGRGVRSLPPYPRPLSPEGRGEEELGLTCSARRTFQLTPTPPRSPRRERRSAAGRVPGGR